MGPRERECSRLTRLAFWRVAGWAGRVSGMFLVNYQVFFQLWILLQAPFSPEKGGPRCFGHVQIEKSLFLCVFDIFYVFMACCVCGVVGCKCVAQRPIPNSRAVCVPSIPQSLIYYTHTHTHTESLFPHKVRGRRCSSCT